MKITFAMLICLLILSACGNTWRGAGHDIERAGQKMQKGF